ncbi:MAG: TGS domain-containing protein, partial [Oscillospiraceae bacterium]|nr:TGS domain-containing protein [Oscillospiraceae bacterium]
MINISLKGGTIKEFEAPLSIGEVAKSIGAGLYKSACAGKIEGQTADLRTVISADCALEILTFEDEAGKKAYWHTASHVLAQAVLRIYPQAKLGIGPAIDNGFFYDFDLSGKSLTPEDLAKIEAEMKAIIKENLPIERFELSPEEAIRLMEEKAQPFKVELIQEHAVKGEPISFYKQGEFTDVCAGPHLLSTGALKAIKLTQCTGAYWRADASKAVLQRVYGTAYPKQADLDSYLAAVEEAKKRDHNKLGRELEYFTTVDIIGQGLPILLPKGTNVIRTLQRWIEDEEEQRGYLQTKT